MSMNYAEKYAPELLEVLIQNSLTSPFLATNVQFIGAKSVHFTGMTTSGYKNHSKAGGFNAGTVNQIDKEFTLAHDRDIEFFVDKIEVDETNQTASIKNISENFEMTNAAPEADALFFSKVATAAKAVSGYNSETALTTYTKANVYDKLKAFLSAGKLRRYKSTGSLIMYVSSTVMDLLEASTAFTRNIDVTSVSENAGIESRITFIDGVTVIEVIDDERFYDNFNFTDGFVPAVGSKKINVLIASLETVKAVNKIQSIYFFNPGTHTKGDGYLYQNRSLSDVIIFPNGKDMTIDSIYVDTDTVATV